MITNLKIQNYALIDNLDITFEKGFSVITGETGAGKSIILGALSMILGQRADAKYVKTGEKKCVIEAHINIDGYGLEGFFDDNDIEYDASDCILRREITCAGKSRAFINDTPVSLATLRDIGERLVDIHSQHQNLMLGNSNFQLSVIDIISDNTKALASYQEAYGIFKEEEEKLTNMEKLLEESRTQEDYMRFQLAELEDAKLADTGEEEILEQKAETMNHAEEIKNSLYIAETQLDDDDNGILTKMRRIAGELSSISNLIPKSNSLSDRINSAHIELKDILSEIRALMDNIEFVPSELQEINDRLDLLYSLEKKYRCEDIDGLISIRDNIKTTLSLIDNSEESIKNQKEIVARAKAKTQQHADNLSALRKKSAKTVEKEIKRRLVTLGMPNMNFVAELSKKDLSLSGQDEATFMFSANQGMTLQPIGKVASGGEIARVMLSMKAMVSNAKSLPTIIFDEIDTGVSGKIAEAMARIMSDMGNGGRQVISITHLPQIAAAGQYHYRVQKIEDAGHTRTEMIRLTSADRISEVAQMISGSTISEAARQQAEELLKNNRAI
ncbi:MAG: DNA repair protein RecN [Prevotella sp.]|nr:DNA repair protein RecN [Prevotella sp.]